jgi:4'-phosphopantetheinyl transferase
MDGEVTHVSAWKAPPFHVALGPGDVHVWRVRLDVAPPALARAEAALADDDRVRAAAFRFAADARRFVVAHAALRIVLARYLDIPPQHIPLAPGPHGKPRLTEGRRIEFSLSHTPDLALCAVASHRAVGVDIERMRDDLADVRALSSRDAAALAAAPADRRTEIFFDLWTRREAYAKGLGLGLALLDEVALVAEPAGWTLVPLTIGPGFAATLAVQGEAGRLSCWELEI